MDALGSYLLGIGINDMLEALDFVLCLRQSAADKMTVLIVSSCDDVVL